MILRLTNLLTHGMKSATVRCEYQPNNIFPWDVKDADSDFSDGTAESPLNQPAIVQFLSEFHYANEFITDWPPRFEQMWVRGESKQGLVTPYTNDVILWYECVLSVQVRDVKLKFLNLYPTPWAESWAIRVRFLSQECRSAIVQGESMFFRI